MPLEARHAAEFLRQLGAEPEPTAEHQQGQRADTQPPAAAEQAPGGGNIVSSAVEAVAAGGAMAAGM
jgi:hypothetical protein